MPIFKHIALTFISIVLCACATTQTGIMPKGATLPDMPSISRMDLAAHRTQMDTRLKQPGPITVQGIMLNKKRLLGFYQSFPRASAWFDASGYQPYTVQYVGLLKNARYEGLRPQDYHYEKVLAELTKNTADAELLLTDRVLKFIEHMRRGRGVVPTIKNQILIEKAAPFNPVPVLAAELLAGKSVPELKEAKVPYKEYDALKKEVARQMRLKETPRLEIPNPGVALEPTMIDAEGHEVRTTDPRLPLIRQRLADEGIEIGNMGSTEYDDELATAIKEYQRRYGLVDDGMLGGATINEMNATPEWRLRTLEANMERWRMVPENLGKRHVRINAAGFTLKAYDDGKMIKEMRVAVGTPEHPTPIFSTTATDVTFNPYWYVPKRIAFENFIPKEIEKPGFLSSQGMVLLQNKGDGKLVKADMTTINFTELQQETFPYVLAQTPGAKNALGRIRFNLRNKMDIYMHDTPYVEFFEKPYRAFSNGCIRVEEPLWMANYMLNGADGYDEKKVQQFYDAAVNDTDGKNSTPRIIIRKHVPVHVQYWTVFEDSNGHINYRNDTYGIDQRIINALY